MRKVIVALSVVAVAIVATCGWCTWVLVKPGGRTLANIEIGGNRIVRIWSKEDTKDWRWCVYYEIIENGEEIVPAMYLTSDRGEPFEFQAAYADNGNLACVWQSNPKVQFDWVILYDNATRESWPQVWWCEQRSDPREWEGRYRRLQDENPVLRARPW
jgi:hypothetical protein